MAETLTSGAMPDDWRPPPEPPEPAPPRWFHTGLPGGGRVDPHPGDVDDPGIYQAPAVPPHATVPEALQYQRAAQATASPHVFRMTSCTGCGTGLTYYGRADRAPAEPRCDQCGPPDPVPPGTA